MEDNVFVGDLVLFNESPQLGSVCLVIDVTQTKKTWHRFITLYVNGRTLRLPWTRKNMIEKI